MRRERPGERSSHLENSGVVTLRNDEPSAGHEFAGTRS
jgi:hypothetical protein